ncbi:hypothetical protein [Streptomyces sp. YPW6]|uniref:hypothetical protein n=1 Tax=Streptomyces sp. YPW6 TaxID=2840373 RepID=UPI003EB9AE1D
MNHQFPIEGDELAVEDDWPAPHAQVPLWIVLSGISSRAVHQYAFLFAHTNPSRDGHRVAFPGQRAIAKALGMAVSKPERVKPYTDELVAIGALRVEEVTTRTGRAYRYILRYNPPPGWDRAINLPQWYDASPECRTRTPKTVATAPPTRTGGSPQIWGDGSPQKRGEGSPQIWGANYKNKNHNKEKDSGADAEGQSAGGFARAGAREGAAGGSGQAAGGSAASGKIPAPRKSPRPKTIKTSPRQLPAGYDLVRAAIPQEVARPGTQLAPMLQRAIADLLAGTPQARIPGRTPEQVIARINRRWYGQNGPERSAKGYVPTSDDEGAQPIRNRSSWLAAAILGQDCSDPACEDGQMINTGRTCPECKLQRDQAQAAARAAAEAAQRWEDEIADRETARDTSEAAQREHQQNATAEENRVRQHLSDAGVFGELLEYRVRQHMAAWRDQHPAPVRRNVPVAGAL